MTSPRDPRPATPTPPRGTSTRPADAAGTGLDPDAAGDTTTAGGPGTSTAGGVSRIGSGTTGLNNYSPGSDLGAGPMRDAARDRSTDRDDA